MRSWRSCSYWLKLRREIGDSTVAVTSMPMRLLAQPDASFAIVQHDVALHHRRRGTLHGHRSAGVAAHRVVGEAAACAILNHNPRRARLAHDVAHHVRLRVPAHVDARQTVRADSVANVLPCGVAGDDKAAAHAVLDHVLLQDGLGTVEHRGICAVVALDGVEPQGARALAPDQHAAARRIIDHVSHESGIAVPQQQHIDGLVV